jgi:mannose/fructose-specific phosphotransferase system component IIA
VSESVRGVVVGHGGIAPALVAAAEQISGIHGVLVAVSNDGAGRDLLEERVVEAVGVHSTVVFVDMPSGSCLFAAMRRLAARPDVRIVTGVNLVMLLDFIFHRDQPVEEAARRAAESGAKAIGAR